MEPAQWGDLLQDTKHARPIELGQTLSPVPKMNDPVFDGGVDLPISPPASRLRRTETSSLATQHGGDIASGEPCSG